MNETNVLNVTDVASVAFVGNVTNVANVIKTVTNAASSYLSTASQVVGTGLSGLRDSVSEFAISTNSYLRSVNWSNILTYITLFITSCIQMFNSLDPLVKRVTVISLCSYAVAWVITCVVAYLKRTRGNADYRSKTGMAIVLYNILNFIAVFGACFFVLLSVGANLYRGIGWSSEQGIRLSLNFHILCMISLFTNIFSGEIPTLTEFFVEHLLLLFGSVLSIVFWSPYNVAFITLLTVATMMSPFMGPYSYYVAVSAHSLNAIVSGYGLYVSGVRDLTTAYSNPLLYVLIYSTLTVLLCIYYVRRRSQYEKVAREKTQRQYLEMMDKYKDSIKGDKVKQKKLREAISALEKKGYNIPELSSMLVDESPKTKSVTFTPAPSPAQTPAVSPTNASTGTGTTVDSPKDDSSVSGVQIMAQDIFDTTSQKSSQKTKKLTNRKNRRRGH